MNNSKKILLVVAGLFLLSAPHSALAGGKKFKQVRYVGIHPIAKNHGGGVCYIEAPHVHIYKPSHAATLYRMNEDHYDFVADPVAYGYDGPKISYYGHHPVTVDLVGSVDAAPQEWCYLDGAHYHEYGPGPGLSFTVHGDANWYIGDLPTVYLEGKPTYAKVNAVAMPAEYHRPVVVVDAPPPGYVGVFVDVKAPVVVVDAPVVEVAPVRGHVSGGVDIHVPVPTIEVGIGLPGLYIEDSHHHDHNEVIVVGGTKRGKYKRNNHGKYKGKKKGKYRW